MIDSYIAGLYRSSVTVGVMERFGRRVGKAISGAGRKSFIIHGISPLFIRFDMLGEIRDTSMFCRGAGILFRWILAAVRAVYGSFSRIPVLKWIARLADVILRLDLGDISAVMIALMLCVDDSKWTNGYMFIAALVVGALYLLRRSRENERKMLPVSFYAFAGFMALAVFRASFRSDDLRVYAYFVTAFVFMLVIAGSVRNMNGFRRVFMILYMAVFINGCLGIMQNIGGVAVNTAYTDAPTNSGMPGRVFASFYNPNNFAEILILLMPPCFVAFITAPKFTKLAKVAACLSFVVPLAALMLTYSRSSWISAALTVAAFVALANVKLILPMIVLCLIAIPVLPRSITNRIMTLFSGNDTSVGYRVYIWKGSLKTLAYNPILGNGLGPNNFYDAYRKFMMAQASVASHSHNLFLEVWLEGGLGAFASFTLMFLSTLKSTFLLVFRGKPEYRYAAISVFSTLFGVIFVSMVEYIWFYPRVLLVFWAVMGMAWALVRMAVKEPAKAE